MSRKRLTVLSLGYLLLLLACVMPVRAEQFARGLLWEISGKAQASSYLLGTIHSDDSRVTRIPAELERALNRADSFVAELDLDMTSTLSAHQAMLSAGGQDLADVLGVERYRRTVKVMAQYGLPEADVQQMKPWAIAVQLSLPKPQSGLFLDLVLYRQAQARGLPIHALETVAEQLAVFNDMPVPEQIIMLDEALDEFSEMPAMIEKLVQLYLQRDLAGLQQYNEQQLQKSSKALADYVERELIIERNLRMVERMQVHLREGKAFIAVGALHLPGENGILNLLQQQGYTIKALY